MLAQKCDNDIFPEPQTGSFKIDPEPKNLLTKVRIQKYLDRFDINHRVMNSGNAIPYEYDLVCPWLRNPSEICINSS